MNTCICNGKGCGVCEIIVEPNDLAMEDLEILELSEDETDFFCDDHDRSDTEILNEAFEKFGHRPAYELVVVSEDGLEFNKMRLITLYQSTLRLAEAERCELRHLNSDLEDQNAQLKTDNEYMVGRIEVLNGEVRTLLKEEKNASARIADLEAEVRNLETKVSRQKAALRAANLKIQKLNGQLSGAEPRNHQRVYSDILHPVE